MGSNVPGGPNAPPVPPIDSSTGLPYTPGNYPGIYQVGDALGAAVQDIVPGAEWIMKLVGDMGQIPDLLDKLLVSGIVQHPMATLEPLFKFAERAGSILELGQIDFWTWMSKIGVGPFFTEFLELGMGIKVGEFNSEEIDAMTTVDTMLAFAVTLPIASAAINSAGKMLFGGRWPDALHEALKGLPEEMGLTWPLGMTIEESFKAAQGTILEEAIKKQKRPTRLEWPQYKQLMKQHVFDTYTVNTDGKVEKSSGAPSADNAKTVMRSLLASSGFTDEAIEWLVELSNVALPMGDIAQLYMREIIDRKQVKELLEKSGYTDQEVTWLLELYIDKAETAAGSALRSTARTLFTNQLIGERQYREILTDSNFPKREVDADIRSVTLVHDVGRIQQSVGLIKSRYLHKQIDGATAIADLRSLNYSLAYATDLIASWDLPPIKAQHGLNQSKLLSYFISGLLSEQQVRDGLAALSVNQATIDFLVAHPSAASGARVLHLGPNMVLQAYVEGAITEQQLPAMFKKSGVAPDDISLWVNKAVYRKSHTRGTSTYTQHLSRGDIVAAFKWGIYDLHTAYEALQQDGYSPDDAAIILEIENKGLFQPPVPPVFQNVNQAYAYLVNLGYDITDPPDPKIQAAEAMLGAQGYTWIPPAPPITGPPVFPPGTPGR